MGKKNITVNENQLKAYSYTSYGTDHVQPDYLQNAKDSFIKEDFHNYNFELLKTDNENNIM